MLPALFDVGENLFFSLVMLEQIGLPMVFLELIELELVPRRLAGLFTPISALAGVGGLFLGHWLLSDGFGGHLELASCRLAMKREYSLLLLDH